MTNKAKWKKKKKKKPRLPRMSIKKKVGRRFFIIANWMLSLQIITLPEGYLEFFSQILVNETLDSNEI